MGKMGFLIGKMGFLGCFGVFLSREMVFFYGNGCFWAEKWCFGVFLSQKMVFLVCF
jgi:hypothetical protein